ncbi:MAG: SpoIIE family protein phosphatase [Planctomycetes bacterium]|nr:SpoIIE family protein phosphatase [Planctomycetota bacterium]
MTDSTPDCPISKEAWFDLKDRLKAMVPAGINISLYHGEYGSIGLGSVAMTASIHELPNFPSINIGIDGDTNAGTNNLFITLIEQLLSDVSETESLSGELVSLYGDLAVLEELGRILPNCRNVHDLAHSCGTLIAGKISAMGCCLIVDSNGEWICAGVWGGAVHIDLNDTDALNLRLRNRRPYIVDRGPLPNVLGVDDSTGSWCSVPMTNENRAEGLIILARHETRAFTSNDAKLLEIMASQMATYILKLHQENELRQAEVLAHEVSLAGGIQQSLLPKAPPPIDGYQVSGRLRTAEHVGGDYFDHIWDGRYLTLSVADVSGHSVPAALAMTMVRTALRSGYNVHPGPAALLQAMNEQLCDDLAEAGLFVSLMVVRIDTTNGLYQVGCAGHPPLLHRHANGDIQSLDADGMILGLMNDTTYEESENVLAEGEALLLYTDGIIEAQNTHHEIYGYKRLEENLAKSQLDPDSILDNIAHATFQWCHGRQNDDCTMLAVVRAP